MPPLSLTMGYYLLQNLQSRRRAHLHQFWLTECLYQLFSPTCHFRGMPIAGVDFVPDPGVDCNLNLLPDPSGLMRSGVDAIAISISGMTQDVYGKNHRGGSIDRVIRNMEELARIKRAEKLKKVRLIVAFHDYLYNREDREAAREFCRSRDMEFRLTRTYVQPVIIAAGTIPTGNPLRAHIAYARQPSQRTDLPK